jgi:hypothetical protein
VGSAARRGPLPFYRRSDHDRDTIEELRAELRDCVLTPAKRKALEVELAELIR